MYTIEILDMTDESLQTAISDLHSIGQKQQLPFKIRLCTDKILSDLLSQNSLLLENLKKYLNNVRSKFNDQFTIEIYSNLGYKEDYGSKSKHIINCLEEIRMLDKVTIVSLLNYDICYSRYLAETDEDFFHPNFLGKLNNLTTINMEDCLCSYSKDLTQKGIARLVLFTNSVKNFCQQHTSMQCFTLNLISSYNNNLSCSDAAYIDAYQELQNTLKENLATLEKLEKLINQINEITKDISCSQQILEDNNISYNVLATNEIACKQALEKKEELIQKFNRLSEILKTNKHNIYTNFFIAKFKIEVEQADPTDIFPLLETITPPFRNDPEYTKHHEIYLRANHDKASMCLDITQYARIYNLNIEACKTPEIISKRIRASVDYALKAEEYEIAAHIIEEYIHDPLQQYNNNPLFTSLHKKTEMDDFTWILIEKLRSIQCKQLIQEQDSRKEFTDQQTQIIYDDPLLLAFNSIKQKKHLRCKQGRQVVRRSQSLPSPRS